MYYETMLWARWVAVPAAGAVSGGMLAAATVGTATVPALIAVAVTAALCGLAGILIGLATEE